MTADDVIWVFVNAHLNIEIMAIQPNNDVLQMIHRAKIGYSKIEMNESKKKLSPNGLATRKHIHLILFR